MNRRRVLAALGATALAPAAFAQGRVRTVGYLSNGADASWLARILADRGYVEGRNLRIQVRIPAGENQVPAMAAELVALRPEVLVAFGARLIDALAAATTTIPIVCGGTADPIGAGYAASLRRPGRNITGISYGIPETAGILVGLMRHLLPRINRIVAIVKGQDPGSDSKGWPRIVAALERAAKEARIGWELKGLAPTPEVDTLLGKLDPAVDLPYFIDIPDAVDPGRLAAAARRNRLATFSARADLARAGLLAHYSLDHADPRRRIGALVDTLLRGANAAETPFELPDRTTFILNRGTAKAIGLVLAPEILARATEIVDAPAT